MTGSAGTTGGSGTSGGAAGTNGGTAGTSGGTAGTSGGGAGTTGGGGSRSPGNGGSTGTAGSTGLGGSTGTAGSGGSGGHTGGSGASGSAGATGTGGAGGGGAVACGGVANVICPSATEFCELPAGICDTVANASGTCVVRSTSCSTTVNPVCGCDGIPYSNDCERQAAGVSKLKDGACDAVPCTTNGSCGSQQFCELPTGACGQQGSCAPKPASCDATSQPVCGCNGVTYTNDCDRQAAGIPKRKDGAC
jgi:hypothetical protein